MTTIPYLPTGGSTETPPPGYVRLVCTDPALRLQALLGPEPPQITAGMGGWSVVGRPREVGMTVWEGVEPYQLSLSLMLDTYAGPGTSIEGNINRLTAVARGDRESPPGVLSIEGIPLPATRWVIEGIDFGDPIRRATDGKRVRQALTLTLREFVPPEFIRRRKSTSKVSSKAVIVRSQKGDTPAKIAKRRKLKSWTEIRALNRGVVKKANQALKTGTKIRVPATKLAAKKKRKGK